ncbi:hypothetical protein SUGI_0312460 [Cryptomeria japonica]|nr:hypothetical protein SUGI_0312460 [Cryptomeria japonica]
MGEMARDGKILSIFYALCLLCVCSSAIPEEYKFMKEASSAAAEESYDYIIVGGGTAGCPLAATLSHNFSVLLLERGGSPYGNLNISRIENFQHTLADSSPGSPSQMFLSEDGVFNSRARVLGGGSCLNAGFYSRASPQYVKKMGWDGELVNRSYPWVEKIVAHEPALKPWQAAVRDALLEVGVKPYNGFTYDHMHGTKLGGTIFDKKGKRHTAADLLRYANGNGLTVLLHATVSRVFFGKGKSSRSARGVIYRDAKGQKHVAYLKNRMSEVIISAGALGSPQLLMLSGIGPADHLKSMGIPVLVDNKGVGKGMADNPMNAIFVPSTRPVHKSLLQVVGITKMGSYIEGSSGFLTAVVPMPKHYGALMNKDAEILEGGFIMEKVKGPLSRGLLRLKNTNVEDNPSVSFNYFSHPQDLERCVKGIKIIEKMVQSKAFSVFNNANVSLSEIRAMSVERALNVIPKQFNDTTSLEQFCKDTVNTIWHYHGGCRVGSVVDGSYRVFGTKALRVIDGSTFVSSPGTNPQATVMMLGRYMGVMIARERLGTGAGV